jgi:nicotinate-nucleotide adenylyltransferase
MPSAVPPHRDQPQTPTDDRRAMVELAIDGQPGFVLETCEIERSGPSYMVDSLALLRDSLGAQTPLVLILGMDAFVNLPQWNRWQELTRHAHLLVTQRPGYAPEMEAELKDWLAPRLVDDVQALRSEPGGCILFRQQVLLEISSTEIRERIGRGLSPRYLLPDAVCDYIRERGLYRP